jgi:hypothetical protein
MKKTRSSTKIAIAFVVLAAGAYFGYGFVSGWIVDRKVFPPIEPGQVNLVGVDTSKGYHIIVANQVAQLVLGSAGEFEASDHSEGREDAAKKRVPIRDLLRSLQGNEEALGRFVMAMNDMSDAEFPAYPRVWKAEDVEKAVRGDKALEAKLEEDLNVRLDGTPLDKVRVSALEEGIVLDSPVEIEVQVGAEKRQLVGRVREQFVPRFSRMVWGQLGEKPDLTESIIIGYYRKEAQKVFADANAREDVRESLIGRISPNRLQALAAIPSRILNSATVIVNDSLIEGARYETYQAGDGKPIHDLVLNLKDEGRQRLWQYSKRNPNSQLLVTWEGIAIAAPRIQGELPLSEVKVKQLMDEGLVKDAVDSINKMGR